MADYEAEFSELAAFVPELIPSERYLCTRFIEGLDLDIRERLAPTSTDVFKEVVEQAQRVEDVILERRARGGFKARRKG